MPLCADRHWATCKNPQGGPYRRSPCQLAPIILPGHRDGAPAPHPAPARGILGLWGGRGGSTMPGAATSPYDAGAGHGRWWSSFGLPAAPGLPKGKRLERPAGWERLTPFASHHEAFRERSSGEVFHINRSVAPLTPIAGSRAGMGLSSTGRLRPENEPGGGDSNPHPPDSQLCSHRLIRNHRGQDSAKDDLCDMKGLCA
jgi:hypothetical protein